MRYKTLLEYEAVSKLKTELKKLTPGLWMLDLDRECQQVLLGPYDTIAEAHNNRDYIWHYGARFGRYLWLVNQSTSQIVRQGADNLEYIEIGIDTLPLEVINFKIKLEGVSEWVRTPTKRISR
jgi:hypothetical protein